MAEDNRLEFMRRLRQKADVLNETIADDLKPFLLDDRGTFLRLPTRGPDDENDIGVTVTCTALMALAATGNLAEFYCGKKHKPHEVKAKLDSVFAKLLGFKWASSGLPQNNAFTAALVLRTAGAFCRDLNLDRAQWREKKRLSKDREILDGEPKGREISRKEKSRRLARKTLQLVAQSVAVKMPNNWVVGKYLPAPPIAYWFLDGVDNLEIMIPEDNEHSWTDVAQWAAKEFTRQLSFVSAGHQALMDPVSLAMAACVCQKLRRIAAKRETLQSRIVPHLPSAPELRNGLQIFFRQQRRAGIWDKYFPMFHYPEAGANHCWSFEVLEALLNEFPQLVNEEYFLRRLSRSVDWCKQYRLTWHGQDWSKKTMTYSGWNSGGQQTTLTSGEPESWATGAVHMFLTRLRECLSDAIGSVVLRKYHVPELAESKKKDRSKWSDTLNSQIKRKGGDKAEGLKELVEKSIIEPIDRSTFKENVLNGAKRSALLFGPPGTGKTSFVKAIARAIGWDFVEINPSTFLKRGLPEIYAQADEIFNDLHDLRRAVVLFDEMDAMVQRRVGQEGARQLDVTQQFLTTSMLPNLASLYDNGRVLFFVATNYRQTFDEAVTRPGRFDMLLFIGPPSWKYKLENLKSLLPKSLVLDASDDDLATLASNLATWAPDEELLAQRLDIATIGELRAMFDELFRDARATSDLKKNQFVKAAERWSKDYFSLREGTELRDQYEKEKDTTEVR